MTPESRLEFYKDTKQFRVSRIDPGPDRAMCFVCGQKSAKYHPFKRIVAVTMPEVAHAIMAMFLTAKSAARYRIVDKPHRAYFFVSACQHHKRGLVALRRLTKRKEHRINRELIQEAMRKARKSRR